MCVDLARRAGSVSPAEALFPGSMGVEEGMRLDNRIRAIRANATAWQRYQMTRETATGGERRIGGRW